MVIHKILDMILMNLFIYRLICVYHTVLRILYEPVQYFNIILHLLLLFIIIRLRLLRRSFYFTLFAELAGVIQNSFPGGDYIDKWIDRLFGVADLVLHTVPVHILGNYWELFFVFWFDCIFYTSWHEYVLVTILIFTVHLSFGLFYPCWGWVVNVLIFNWKFKQRLIDFEVVIKYLILVADNVQHIYH